MKNCRHQYKIGWMFVIACQANYCHNANPIKDLRKNSKNTHYYLPADFNIKISPASLNYKSRLCSNCKKANKKLHMCKWGCKWTCGGGERKNRKDSKRQLWISKRQVLNYHRHFDQ